MKEKTKQVLRSHFTATHIAYMALFTALAFAVTFLEFPLFPAAPFLKLDFANVFFMIEGFIFGPVEAVVSILVKELLCLAKSSSGGIGELANFLMSSAFILIPAIAYRFKKGRGWVALYLLCACVMQTAVSLPVNRYINFPFFVGGGAAKYFGELWLYVLLFNLIKSVLISLIVLLIYKPLSHLIKATAEKFAKKKHRGEEFFPADELNEVELPPQGPPAEEGGATGALPEEEPASACLPAGEEPPPLWDAPEKQPAPEPSETPEPASACCPPPHGEGE